MWTGPEVGKLIWKRGCSGSGDVSGCGKMWVFISGGRGHISMIRVKLPLGLWRYTSASTPLTRHANSSSLMPSPGVMVRQ